MKLKHKLGICFLILFSNSYGCGCVDPFNATKNAEELKALYDSADASFAEVILAVNELNKESITISEANKIILGQNVGLAILKATKGYEAVHKSIILKELR